MTMPVDEERRRSVHSTADTALEVGADTGFESSLLQRLTQRGGRQLELFGELQIEYFAQALLIFIQLIVHLPELALGACKLRHFGGSFGGRVHFAQGKIAKHQPQAFSKVLLNLLDNEIGLSAIRTLVIAVLHQGHVRGFRALDVVFDSDRYLKCGHKPSYFGKSSRACRIPSAPGFTATGEQ